MKYLIFILAISLLISSCTKKTEDSYNEYTNYQQSDYEDGEEETDVDDVDWRDEYLYGGVLDYTIYINEIVGTKWLLWKYNDGFTDISMSDTIEFVNNTQYRVFVPSLGVWSAVRKFTLSELPTNINQELTLYNFSPFGGSAYSAQLGGNFIEGGIINSAHFTNLYDSNTPQIKAWFTKVN